MIKKEPLKWLAKLFPKRNRKGYVQNWFLDAILALRDNTCEHFKKNSWKVVYIHNQSNHPRFIRRYITPEVSKHLGKLSSNKHIFECIKKPYNKDLTNSGHNLINQYTDDSQIPKKKRRTRGRKSIYFNRVFSNNVKTNQGKQVLK